MTTYAEMKFNAENHLNPVSVVWEQVVIDEKGIIDEMGDEDFTTYEEAQEWVEKYILETTIEYQWKIVDTITHKTIENNEDWPDDFYEDDEELIEEYKQELKDKRKEEKVEKVIRKLAISKIKRNKIYNLGLGLKLAIKAYNKDF